MNYQPIENYGVVGDLTTTALISMEGSIDFMCFPKFDSPTIFAALLDSKNGGRFSIAPASGDFKNRQRYFPDTSILLNRPLGLSHTGRISAAWNLDARLSAKKQRLDNNEQSTKEIMRKKDIGVEHHPCPDD